MSILTPLNLMLLSLRVVTPVFMERKEGKEKIVSFYAKNARGANGTLYNSESVA